MFSVVNAINVNMFTPENKTYLDDNATLNYLVTGNQNNYSCSDNQYDSITGLISSWRFDEANGTKGVNDINSSLNGTYLGETFNNGTVYNNPLWTTYGKFGNAFQFNGNNTIKQNITIPNSVSLNLSKSFTVMAWVKYNNTNKMYYTSIIDKRVPLSGASNFFIYELDWAINGNLSCGWYDGGTTFFLISNSSLADNNWHHVSCVRDKVTGRGYMYIDGILDNSAIDSTVDDSIISSFFNNQKLTIGTSPNWGTFNGTIDEVRIFDKALTNTEILIEKAFANPVIRPVASYSFETNSTIAYDTHNYVLGSINSGLSFDGVNDFINITNSSVFNPTVEITISAWIKIKSNGTVQDIIRKSNQYTLELSTDNRLRFWINNGTWQNSGATGILSTNTWYFITGTYNSTGGSNNLNVYLNGLLSSSSTKVGNIYTDIYSLFIGSDDSGSGSWTNGTIDEVKIWNRSLSSQEVFSLYNSMNDVYTINNNTLKTKTLNAFSDGVYFVNAECRGKHVINSEIDSESRYYTLSNLPIIGNCTTSGFVPFIKFDFKHELNKTPINATLEINFEVYNVSNPSSRVFYDFNISNNQSATFCVFPYGNSTFYLNSMAQYYNDVSRSRNYYIINGSFNSSMMQEITLYLVEDTHDIRFTVLDDVYIPIEDAIINIQKFDISENNYFTVAMVKSDYEGEGISHLITEDSWYRFVVNDYATTPPISYSFSQKQLYYDISIGYVPVELILTESEEMIYIRDFSYNCTNYLDISDNVIIRCVFTNTEGLHSTICLEVYNNTQGANGTLIINSCTSDVSSTLYATFQNVTGSYFYRFIYTDSLTGIKYLVDSAYVFHNIISSIGYPKFFIFVSITLIAMMSLLTVFKPSMMIFTSIISLILCSKLFELNIGLGSITALAIIGLMIILRLNEK